MAAVLMSYVLDMMVSMGLGLLVVLWFNLGTLTLAIHVCFLQG